MIIWLLLLKYVLLNNFTIELSIDQNDPDGNDYKSYFLENSQTRKEYSGLVNNVIEKHEQKAGKSIREK